MPAIYQAGSQEPDTIETTRDSTGNVPNDGSEEAIYMVDDSRGSCGALIAFGHSRLATMGGILLINGTYYGISAQHGRYEFLEEPEDSTNEGVSLCFDDDSDAEDSDLDNLIEITSRESISSYSDEGSSTLSFASTTSPKDRIFEYPINIPGTTELTLDHTPEVPSPSQPTYSSNPKISKLLPFERNDLDYEVFKIDDPRYHSWNKIDLPSSRHPIRHILPNKVARTLVECPVWAATGTTGCVQGTMMKQTHYIKMAGSGTFQEMWAVKLDRNTKPGDSGAWVVDSDGQIYGHIVAGDPMLGLAFIIPAYKIFDDIKRRFGSEALCCHSGSPHNALKEYVSRYETSVGFRDTLFYDVEQFAQEAQMQDMLPLLMEGALVAQDPSAFKQITELDEVERDALRNEVLHKWRQPTALYFTVILCSIGAAVQGWVQTGSNGANLSWPDDFGVPDTAQVPPVLGVNYATNSWIVGVVNSFPYIAKQTWAPSRSFRRSDNPSLDPTHRTFLMVSVLLSVPLYLPWANYGIVFICLGGPITYIMLQTASEFFISSFPIASHLPFANGSVVSIGICQVAFVIASPLAIITMCPYMSVHIGAGYFLAGILIRDGHELQIGTTWFVTSLGLGVSALSASNSALYLASRALYGKTHLSQHEENARFWNSRHITSPNLTQVLLTRLLQLMFWNDHSEWQRIAHGGRHARTDMYLACPTNLNWRLMLVSPMVLPLIAAAYVFTLPESPRWYLLKVRQGKAEYHTQALRSLCNLRHSNLQAARDLIRIYHLLDGENEIKKGTNKIFKLSYISHNNQALIASLTVMFLQQICGVNVMALYSSEVLAKVFSSGTRGDKNALLGSMGFGILNFTCWSEQYLQTLEQEVLHRRAGFCRGNLLGTSMIMFGTPNQLVAALSNATVSFGSMVPIIGSYTYIGYNQETTNDAAADRIDEVHKTVNQSTARIVGTSVNLPLCYLDIPKFDIPISSCRYIAVGTHYSDLSFFRRSVPATELINGWRFSDQDLGFPTNLTHRWSIFEEDRFSTRLAERSRLPTHSFIGYRTWLDVRRPRIMEEDIICLVSNINGTWLDARRPRTMEEDSICLVSNINRTWLDARRPRTMEEDSILVSNIMDYIEYISDNSDPTNFQGFLLKNGLLDLWENQILWDDGLLMSGRIGLRFRRRIYRLRWYACGFLLFSGLSSGAIPNHDARQLRRRRLNAPRRREDNSQCSESREGERQ